jgi:hypothetical protein
MNGGLGEVEVKVRLGCLELECKGKGDGFMGNGGCLECS